MSENEVDESIWHIMTSRALKKIMNTLQVDVIVTQQHVTLQNSTDQSILKVFDHGEVAKAQTHGENSRLFALIVASSPSSGNGVVCYAFECFDSGIEICCAINTAKVISLSKIEFEESEKQKTKQDEK